MPLFDRTSQNVKQANCKTTKGSENARERNIFIKCDPGILKRNEMLEKYLGRRALDRSATWSVYNIFLRCWSQTFSNPIFIVNFEHALHLVLVFL